MSWVIEDFEKICERYIDLFCMEVPETRSFIFRMQLNKGNLEILRGNIGGNISLLERYIQQAEAHIEALVRGD